MNRTQALLWSATAAAFGLAVFAGWRERVRKRRIDLDAVGMISWPTVQVLALIALAVCGSLAFSAQ